MLHAALTSAFDWHPLSNLIIEMAGMPITCAISFCVLRDDCFIVWNRPGTGGFEKLPLPAAPAAPASS
ncbi:hypothetical protein Vi05172_g6316 [Venturia inaequalis]|nr:hypothetical protein Vi05172_g6316 [Venturia inaequalis]